MFNFLRHLFFPHHTNNQRPKVLHNNSLSFLILALLGFAFLLNPIGHNYPSVLGISNNVNISELLSITNQRRQEAGLAPLTLNQQLSIAADAKAKYMFEKNFWAHVAPDGTTPWYFIKSAGYEYLYAGENLARGFNSSSDVVNAWMASPTHRDNMLSPNYKDIGFAVETGTLTGSDTVLVVEEFGSKYNQSNSVQTKNPSPFSINISPTPQPSLQPTPSVSLPISNSKIAAAVNNPLVDVKSTKQNLSYLILGAFIMVLIIDALIIERRKIQRAFSHNLDHIIFLIILLIAAIIIGGGIIL